MQEKIRSFLVINPFGIGDVLFSTPLLRNIKDNYPESEIYYLCNKKTGPVIKNNPLIKKAFIYERDDFVNAQKRSWFAWFKKFNGFISEIRKEDIDVCLDLSLNSQYAFFAMMAGIRKRYGLDYKGRGVFLSRKVRIPGFVDKHVADYYLDVLRFIGITPKKTALEVFADAQSRAWADAFMTTHNIAADAVVVGIAPCGGDAFGKDAGIKRWPAIKFAELIDRLTGEFKAKVFIFAGPKEKEDLAEITDSLKIRNGVYEFSDATLAETIALVDKCRVFIGNDTGPLRFADGLRKKLVAIFGPVDENVYGPYPFEADRTAVIKKDMPCRPCYNKFRLSACKNERRCMNDISVDTVTQAVKRLLTEK